MSGWNKKHKQGLFTYFLLTFGTHLWSDFFGHIYASFHPIPLSTLYVWFYPSSPFSLAPPAFPANEKEIVQQ